MAGLRPYSSVEQLQQTAVDIWRGCSKVDYLEAFAGHPKIGDPGSLPEKYASTRALASREQASVELASAQVRSELAEQNLRYFERFGFIFIVFATGKSAQEMLNLLNNRLGNSRHEELHNAANEQAKITQMRIAGMLCDQVDSRAD